MCIRDRYTDALLDVLQGHEPAIIETAAGVGKGDRVAAYLPNMPEAIIAMLATASLGAIWSSASPDFGIRNSGKMTGKSA